MVDTSNTMVIVIPVVCFSVLLLIIIVIITILCYRRLRTRGLEMRKDPLLAAPLSSTDTLAEMLADGTGSGSGKHSSG